MSSPGTRIVFHKRHGVDVYGVVVRTKLALVRLEMPSQICLLGEEVLAILASVVALAHVGALVLVAVATLGEELTA